MPKSLISICLLLSLCINGFAQENKKHVLDLKSQAFTDSVKSGMTVIARELGKPVDKLKFYVFVEQPMLDEEGKDSYTITMNEYSQDKTFKYQKLIKDATEFVKVDDKLMLPSIFDMDLFTKMREKGFCVVIEITDGKETIKTFYTPAKK